MSLMNIARHAGVSIATVSRVINKSPRVRPATAQRVWRSIEQLRLSIPVSRTAFYAAAGAEDSFLSGQNGIVSLALLGGLDFQKMRGVYLEVIAGVVSELQKLGLKMLVTEVPTGAELGPIVRNLDADGAIILGQTSERTGSDVEEFARLLPGVWVMGTQLGPATVDHVIPHNQAIGDLAFRYLRGRGCTRFAYIFQEVWSPRPNAVGLMRAEAFAFSARLAGFNAEFFLPDGMSADGLAFEGPTVRTAGNGLGLIDRLVSSLTPGTGLFLTTDSEMARLYPQLLARGLQPGRDVTVIGCDNDATALMPLCPRPATIDINLSEIGRQAVRRLMRRIRHPEEPPLVIELPPRLIDPDRPTQGERAG